MATAVFILATAQGAAARESSKSVNRLSDVTWVNASPEPIQVVFTDFQPPDPPGGSRQTGIPVEGPFSQPIRIAAGGQVTDTIRADTEDGTYFYEVHDDNGRRLAWLNPIGPPPDDFGGVEVHGPPPRT